MMSITIPTTWRSEVPLPVYRRLREEAPLYYNEQYDFFALRRYEDVEQGLVDSTTYSSSRGGILELIKADIEIPPATLIFEDPAFHTLHRRLLSKVFTPKRTNILEPSVRKYCIQALESVVGSDRFDFVAASAARCDEGDRNAARHSGRREEAVGVRPTPMCRPCQASLGSLSTKIWRTASFRRVLDSPAAHPSRSLN